MNGLDFFVEALPPSLAVEYGRRVEEAGFRAAWFPEITFGDSFVPATAMATGTSRLVLGTGVVGIWSRSAVTMALQAATLNELSNGRLLLGVGLQARSYVVGLARPHVRAADPRDARVRDHPPPHALAGEPSPSRARSSPCADFQLQMPLPEQPARIYMAAIGPQMTRLAGEIADGVLGYCWSAAYVRDVVLPATRARAPNGPAGRSTTSTSPAAYRRPSPPRTAAASSRCKGQVMMFATATSSSPLYA